MCQIEAHKDPFLRSIAYWVLEDYSRALDTLLEQPCKSPRAGANFGECDAGKSVYLFLLFIFFLFPSVQYVQFLNSQGLFFSVGTDAHLNLKVKCSTASGKVESFCFYTVFQLFNYILFCLFKCSLNLGELIKNRIVIEMVKSLTTQAYL